MTPPFIMKVYDPMVIDLTKMFGAGNEPTTIEEFYARIPMGVDINAYNEGEVISMAVEGIKSVGRNHYDGERARVIGGKTYYLGGEYTRLEYNGEAITLPSNKLFTPSADGEIIAEGTDICINLSDTDFNGTYEPYIEVSEDLSFVAKYFPNGMRSHGSAHDEIRFNEQTSKWEAVQRIGEDGNAIAEPIVTEIEGNPNLDYKVWNGGTEQAIAEGKSTPLVADIIYGFNAVAKIKENADKVAKNTEEIAKLKQSSGSTTTYKTINGTSVVGSGNIDTHYPISSSTASALTIQPNTYYKWSGSSLNVTLGSTDANLCEFVIELAPSGTPSITFPSSVKWANGIAPTFASGKTYIVSIINNLGVYAAF